MIELEVDGQKVAVPEGSMVMHAAQKVGVYIPHFCYHKKLSIAANCRMCLVEVEKAPKVLPACATPVTQGMVVHTHSEKAKAAQKSVMEFLLINHPLDCPICDQGGECQLQDIAVGYGGVQSRYQEEKRIVFHKSVGPLISMEEMSRCIHCTRCVRFGQEVAGQAEFGMLNRGEHSEITAFVGKTVNSELSGNMIDLCPVGALTSKPFRYTARTWELTRRRSISAHDALGSHLIVQTKNDEVKRVLPLENEAINDCWISDRDRFAYEGLNHADRALAPMIKKEGQWQTVDWQTALTFAVEGLQGVAHNSGSESLVALMHGNSTTEEMYLLNALWQNIGSEQIDFRLRQLQFAHTNAVPHLGVSIAELAQQNHVLLVGSLLRFEQPLLAARLRQGGAKVSRISSVSEDLLMPAVMVDDWTVLDMADALHQVIVAIAKERQLAIPGFVSSEQEVTDIARRVAKSLLAAEKALICIGQLASQSMQAAQIYRACRWLQEQTHCRIGWLGEAANTAGGYWVGAYRSQSPLAKNCDLPQKAYVLLGLEPDMDVAEPLRLLDRLNQSQFNLSLTAYLSETLLAVSNVILPITPYTETSGTFVNIQGDVQSFQGVVRPKGQSRPGWKVIRALANLLGHTEMNFESSEAVLQKLKRDRPLVLGDNLLTAEWDSGLSQDSVTESTKSSGVSALICSTAIYGADPVVRRAASLQSTHLANQSRKVALSEDLWMRLGLSQNGATVKLSQQSNHLVMDAYLMKNLPPNTVWMQTASIPHNMLSMRDPIMVERI